VALAVLAPPARAERTVTSTEIIVTLRVRPMAAPRPALRYLLLPEIKDTNPGNPIPNYLRCSIERDQRLDLRAIQRREQVMALPLERFPAAELVDYGGASLRQADRAARLDKPDWQIVQKLRTDGYYLLLPDVQKMRNLAAELQVRFRAEAALRRYDDAVRTAQTMFAMSRHMGEHPTLIGDLVGIAIAAITIGRLEEMLEQPGCPNLYWALTVLPRPLVGMERGWEGERAMIVAEFGGLDDSAPMDDAQIRAAVDHLQRLFVFEEGGSSLKPYKTLREWLDAHAADKRAVRDARRRLVEYGLRSEAVERFPAEQVILLDERRAYEELRDDVMKLTGLPAWQMEALAGPAKPYRGPALFGGLVGVGLRKVRRAEARLEQQVGLLRCVEALRLYAAAHGGKLPDKLSEVGVPLPDDPFTGKPFRYRLEGATAHLRGSPPPGEEKNAGFNVRYEITIDRQ
jgi:hypothetical protein